MQLRDWLRDRAMLDEPVLGNTVNKLEEQDAYTVADLRLLRDMLLLDTLFTPLTAMKLRRALDDRGHRKPPASPAAPAQKEAAAAAGAQRQRSSSRTRARGSSPDAPRCSLDPALAAAAAAPGPTELHAVRLQAAARGLLARTPRRRLLLSLLSLQAGVRGLLARARCRCRSRAGVCPFLPAERRFLSGKHHPLEYTTRILLVYFESRKRVDKPRPRPLKPPNLSQT